MNTDRLLPRSRTLGHLAPGERDEVLDAVREEIGRERRWQNVPEGPVEVERERRLEAETLRDVLEAISRPAGLDETLEEVLKQLSRIVSMDSCSLSLLDPEGAQHIAARGLPTRPGVIGAAMRGAHRTCDGSAAGARGRLRRRAVGQLTARAIRSGRRRADGRGARVSGLLCLDDTRGAFGEEALHRAKAVASPRGRLSKASSSSRLQVTGQVERGRRLTRRRSGRPPKGGGPHSGGARGSGLPRHCSPRPGTAGRVYG